MKSMQNLGSRLVRGLAMCSLSVGTSIASASVLTPDIPYSSPGAPGDELTLDLYRPWSGIYSGGYTIVLLHGGSYCCGDKRDFAAQASALADLGYAVLSINYTLTTPTSASYPQPVIDTLNAMRWIRTQGAAYGIPDRVILGGHSAGSTVAITAAMVAQSPLAANFQNLPPADRRGMVVDGAIGISGRYDIAWNVSVGIPGTVVQYLGVNIGAPGWLQFYQNASAINYVNPCAPPTVLIHGSNDALVPAENSRRLAGALAAALVPVELNIIAGGSHDINVAGDTPFDQAARIAQAAQYISSHTAETCGRTGPSAPVGGCCDNFGACTITTLSACQSASWHNATPCAAITCPSPGVCCDGANCSMLVQSACAAQWVGSGACTGQSCIVQPTSGICCRGATCNISLLANCTGTFTRFRPNALDCNAAGSFLAPCKSADFNKDGISTVQDVLDFLGMWFTGDPMADYSGNGVGTPGVQSIFSFLGAWFAG